MVWEASFMSIQVSFDMANINNEEFEVRWKVSKNSKLTCNWKLPKMESSSPQIYFIIKASNEFLSNMKVEYLALTFPKSLRTWISHEWLESYDQIIFTKSWTSKGHISQTIWPILVGFLPPNHMSSPLSKNINFMSQNIANQNGIFEPSMCEIQVWPMVDFLNYAFLTLGANWNLLGILFAACTKENSCKYLHPSHSHA